MSEIGGPSRPKERMKPLILCHTQDILVIIALHACIDSFQGSLDQSDSSPPERCLWERVENSTQFAKPAIAMDPPVVQTWEVA